MQISELKELEDSIRADNVSLKKQLQDLDSFKQIYVRNMVEEERPYADLPYSQIELDHL